jgi:hypothetical protein
MTFFPFAININSGYYMIVTRVNPKWCSWDQDPHTRGRMWIFPMRQDVLDFNRSKVHTQEEKNEFFQSVYMFRDVDWVEDHGYCSGSGSLDGDTHVWWNVVKKRTFKKAEKNNAVFEMIFKTNDFVDSGSSHKSVLGYRKYPLSYCAESYSKRR